MSKKVSKQIVNKLKSLGFMRMNRHDLALVIPMTYFVNYHVTRNGYPNGSRVEFNFAGTRFGYRSRTNKLTYCKRNDIYIWPIDSSFDVVNDLELIMALYK